MARNENRLKPIVIAPKMAKSRPAAPAPLARSVTVASAPPNGLAPKAPTPAPSRPSAAPAAPAEAVEVSVEAALAEDLGP